MLETYEYPSGYKLKYLYDEWGNQHEVRTSDAANTLLWKANAENQRGQLTEYSQANGVQTFNMFDQYGYLTQTNSVSFFKDIEHPIQNFGYSFDPATGNLLSRTDIERNLSESFAYDNTKERLASYTHAGVSTQLFYYQNGNISKKGDVTSSSVGYTYGAKPHAVTGINNPTSAFVQQAQPQDISFTPINKVALIRNSQAPNHQLAFTYGPDDQRMMSVLYTTNPSAPLMTKYYSENYEKEVAATSVRELHYLQSPSGLFAIMVKQGTNETMYYTHNDHLGSLTAISDATGNLVESLSYDPWGRRRNPNNWNDYNVSSTLFDRGFTGHEHLPQFGLINMNGRVYDPFLARFLSPDPFVQAPDNNQNFNRYSYAFNNPLKYTDPDGEWVHLVVGGIIGGVVNWAANGAEFSWRGLGFFGVGVLAGTLSAGVGAGFGALASGAGSFGFSASAGLSTVGFGAGFASGSSAGLASGLVTGTGNSLLLGNSVQQALQEGIKTGAWSSLTGGFLGGTLSGINALTKGMNFWNGPGNGGINGQMTSFQRISLKDMGLPSKVNSSGLRSQLDDLIEPELKPGIYGKIQYPSEIRMMDAAKGGLAEARALGIAGEEAVNVGAKTRIPSLTGTAKYRIPDQLTSTTLGEVKNVSNLSLTRQLTDFHLYSQQTGRQFILYTRPTTTFSGPLQYLINNGSVIVKPIPFR